MAIPTRHPFREFVLKLASRCNIACAYCYMYEMADQTWQAQPAVMTQEVLDRISARMAEHAKAHEIPLVHVVFHGGEPLLAGVDRVAYAAGAIRGTLSGVAEVDLALQTNGTLITAETLRVMREHRISVGVSLDGDQKSHDRQRLRKDGRGSYAAVSKGLRLLTEPQNLDMFSGLLCTVDVDSDPIAVYEGLLDYSPPKVDFLLPHGNWETYPPGLDAGEKATPYAAWLITIFDRWYEAPRQETSVRLFEELIHSILGGQSATEQIGLSPTAHVVVDTDGSIEQVDSLRSAYDGAADTGLNVLHNSFDEALAHPDIRARQLGLAGLGDECQRCPIVRVCGGGNYAHRYRPGHGFRNPSVYCLDLQSLIGHVSRRLAADLRQLREAK